MNSTIKQLLFFEDSLAPQFFPVSLLRPVFELVCGQSSLRERLLRYFSPCAWGALLRPELRETYHETFPDCQIDNAKWISESTTLCINGRWLGDPRTLSSVEAGTSGWIGEELAWVVLNPKDSELHTDTPPIEHITSAAQESKRLTASGHLIHYPWDLIHHNPEMLTLDFELRDRTGSAPPGPQTGLVGNVENLFIAPDAEIDPFVVLDTRHGPIWIDSAAKLQAFTRIEGPAFIGAGTQTFRANIREGTTIGPVCRVGGEVEESILHGYANKYHDGFLGHSYVCPWVNLGALSTNSDLKNDYSDVSVPLVGHSIATGSGKVGCFIGDHTKTAIGSFFNTGSSIGVMSMVLPAGELQPKFVPSFSRLWHGRVEELPGGIESSIETARTAMGRRQQSLTPAMEALLRETFQRTEPHRQAAFDRQAARP